MSKKSPNDAYYTNPDYAKECYQKALEWASSRFCEPANGNGAFGKLMPENSLLIDIEPQDNLTVPLDFLKWTGRLETLTVVSNPPFGYKCQLAIDFFNHCAKLGAEVIAFIVPRTFRKANTQNKLDLHYELVFDETSPKDVFILDGKPYNVRCCFQVWKRIANGQKRSKLSTDATNEWFEFGNRKTANCCFFRTGARSGEVLIGTDHSPQMVTFITTKKITPEALREISLKMDRSAATNTPARNGMTSKEFLDACMPYLIGKQKIG